MKLESQINRKKKRKKKRKEILDKYQPLTHSPLLYPPKYHPLILPLVLLPNCQLSIVSNLFIWLKRNRRGGLLRRCVCVCAFSSSISIYMWGWDLVGLNRNVCVTICESRPRLFGNLPLNFCSEYFEIPFT